MDNAKQIIIPHWKTFIENCLKDMLREGYIINGKIVPDFLFSEILKNSIIDMGYYIGEGEDLLKIDYIQKGLSENKRAESKYRGYVEKFQKAIIDVTEGSMSSKVLFSENSPRRIATTFSMNNKDVFNTSIGFSKGDKFGWHDTELETHHHFFYLVTQNKTIIEVLSESVKKPNIFKHNYSNDVYFFADNEAELGDIIRPLFHFLHGF